MPDQPGDRSPAVALDAAWTSTVTAAWSSTLTAAGATAPAAELAAAGADLLRRWGQPHRRYHDLEHLAEVLSAVDLLARHTVDQPAVRLAAWFHDAVYDGSPGQDEEASAVLAERVLGRLGLPVGRTAAVGRLVRMTAAHSPDPSDPDAAVLSDADLAVLAAAPARYRRYRLAVRAEYAHLTDQQFRSGREAVLRRIAGRRPIFSTSTGVARWEGAARANLAAELALLAGSGHGVPDQR